MRINSTRKIHWDIIAMFVVLLCCDTAAQLFFKKATLSVGEIPLDSLKYLAGYLIELSQNVDIWLGVFAIAIAFFSWLAVISKIDLSKAHLITCLAYGAVPLCSFWLLNEVITLKQLAGIVMIVMGAYVASIAEKSSLDAH